MADDTEMIPAPAEKQDTVADLDRVLHLITALKQAKAAEQVDENVIADDDIPVLTEVYSSESSVVFAPAPETQVAADDKPIQPDEILTLLQEALLPLIEKEVKKVVQQELAISEKILSKAIAKRFKDAMKAYSKGETIVEETTLLTTPDTDQPSTEQPDPQA